MIKTPTKLITGDQVTRAMMTGAATAPAVVQLKHLPYEFGALEPVISGHLMDYHFSKHHRAYVNNLNTLA